LVAQTLLSAQRWRGLRDILRDHIGDWSLAEFPNSLRNQTSLIGIM